FVEAKQFHGLRRARYRGLQKVSIQALMTAMAQNIKRIIKRLLDIYRDLGRYPYLRKEIFSPQNYPFYFKHTPRTFLYKPALAYNQFLQQAVCTITIKEHYLYCV
ncbi:MAG: transposase, partial [Nitrosomonas sp.]|nr:transposase [Nitrosomonas sp.]